MTTDSSAPVFDLCPDTGIPISPVMRIQPDWIDYNGHLNVAYYLKLFDQGVDHLFARVGLSENYIRTRNMSFFALESHLRYLRELRLEDPVQVRVRLLDLDEKRIHYWMELVHAEERWLSSTLESISIHMDMAVRRSAPFPPDIMARLEGWRAQAAGLERPEATGRPIGIRRKG